MIGLIKSLIRARYGGVTHRQVHSEMVSSIPSVAEALRYSDDRWPELTEVGSDQSPVFLLSSSWRAGSTALQRLVTSSRDVLVWGEPYRDCNYVQTLSESLRSFTERQPNDKELSLAQGGLDLSQEWIATMSPLPADLKRAHIAFMETMYAQPAAALGYPRWGIKEVRLDLGHAAYLRWLFPQARFVFLYRDLYQAYRSYRVFPTWYARWPHEPVLSARDFGLHWQRLTDEFVREAEAFGGYLLAYESLRSRPEEVAAELSDHLAVELDATPLTHAVTGRGKENDAKRPPPITRAEISALQSVAGPLASRLGYAPER